MAIITMKVKCINIIPIDEGDPTYPDFTLGNIYTVYQFGESHYYLLIGNEGRPFYYNPARFEVVDNTIDEDWVVEKNVRDNTSHYSPKVFSTYKHWSIDYHEHKIEAIKFFDQYVLTKFRRENVELEGIISHSLRTKSLDSISEQLKCIRWDYDYPDLTVIDMKCINNHPIDPGKKLHPDITKGNIYSILGIEGENYRLIGDLGKPYLYNKSRFEPVEIDKGNDWIKIDDINVGEISYPVAQFTETNFFEEYFLYNFEAIAEIIFYASRIREKKMAKIYDKELVNKLTRPIDKPTKNHKRDDFMLL